MMPFATHKHETTSSYVENYRTELIENNITILYVPNAKLVTYFTL